MSKFEAGKTYAGNHIGDSNLYSRMTVAKRTEKTLTTSEGNRFKIRRNERDGSEYIQYGAGVLIDAEDGAAVETKPAPVAHIDAWAAWHMAQVWSRIARELLTVIQSPVTGNYETRDASEAACMALQARFPAGRTYHTVSLGWRFVIAPEAAQ